MDIRKTLRHIDLDLDSHWNRNTHELEAYSRSLDAYITPPASVLAKVKEENGPLEQEKAFLLMMVPKPAWLYDFHAYYDSFGQSLTEDDVLAVAEEQEMYCEGR